MSQSEAIRLARPDQYRVEETPWGKLIWQVSAERGNSEVLTVGRCILDHGQANGRHYHPDCDEVLEVLSGSIIHSWGDKEVPMERGDVISIPAGVVHNARNVGQGTAELLIVFSTGYRTAIAAE